MLQVHLIEEGSCWYYFWFVSHNSFSLSFILLFLSSFSFCSSLFLLFFSFVLLLSSFPLFQHHMPKGLEIQFFPPLLLFFLLSFCLPLSLFLFLLCRNRL
ncbi:hypothetical protein Pfo_003429 [Paulownia fortunei]|nr:hypothetical protein Pfo_003429 [Paulownia fortunei]